MTDPQDVGRMDCVRSNIDYEVNVKAELELEVVRLHEKTDRPR